MALLRLQEPMKAGFRKLSTLDKAALSELNALISQNLENLLSPEAALKLSSSLKGVDGDSVFEMLNSVVPFVFNRLSVVEDISAEIDELIRAIGTPRDGVKWGKADEKKLRANLSLLLENPKTRLKSKSIRLMTSHANQFDECDIVSDIRPIFSADGKLTAEAAVICHTLRLGYVDDDHKEFFVTLTAKDLTSLKKAIDRALEKENILNGLISKMGIESVSVS